MSDTVQVVEERTNVTVTEQGANVTITEGSVEVVSVGIQGPQGGQGPQGIQGSQGPPGPGSADANFTYPFTFQSTIVVQHNLNKKPAVSIVDSAGDEVVGNVRYDNSNQVTITLSAPTGGVVCCN